MVFFYLGYWWFTRGRPFAQRLAIALPIEAARVSASLFLLPPEKVFPEPAAIALSFAIHLAAVVAFLSLMHFGGKAISARKAQRASIAVEKRPPAQPDEIAEAVARGAESIPPQPHFQQKRGTKILTPLIAAALGLGAAGSMFIPSALELYNNLIEARTIEQITWEEQQKQPMSTRAICDDLSGAYIETLVQEEEATPEGQLAEAWTSVAEDMPGDTGPEFLDSLAEFETRKLECRRELKEIDVGEAADAREVRGKMGMQYVELSERLNRPGYLEGAMLAARPRQQYCPTAFDSIQCSALMPNVALHQDCLESQARSSICKSELAAREAKLLSVLTCESNAAKQMWGSAAVDRAQDFNAHLKECVVPAENRRQSAQRAESASDLFQQHFMFAGGASLIAALVLAGAALLVSARGRPGQ